MRFLGNSEAKTDAKGRVFLPANFRKQLQTASEESLIMRKDIYQDCLILYPESAWNEQMNELDMREHYVNEFIAKAKEYIEMPKLTPELLRVFIRKIEVMEKTEKYSRTCGNKIGELPVKAERTSDEISAAEAGEKREHHNGKRHCANLKNCSDV